MFCYNCGCENSDNTKFCKKCGTPLTPADASPVTNIINEESEPSQKKKTGIIIGASIIAAVILIVGGV